MPPVFFKPGSVAVLTECMSYIAGGAPKTPFLYYHLPGMTFVSLSMPDFLDAAYESIPTFAGIKFSDTALQDVTEIQMRIKKHMEKGDKRVSILFGVDEQYDTAMFMGVDGGVGSTYNYASKVYNNIVEAYKRGDMGIFLLILL